MRRGAGDQVPPKGIDNTILVHAASIICAGKAPKSFIDLLTEQVAFLPTLAAGTATIPTRTEMAKRLDTAAHYASGLSRELSEINFATTATLGKYDFDYKTLGQQIDLLGNMIAQAQLEIRKGGGKDRAPSFVNGVALKPRPPELVCAVIVSSSWRAARGLAVPHTNSDARQAAALIWEAASLPSVTDNWPEWIKRAKMVTAEDTMSGSLAPWFVQRWAAFAYPQGNSA